MEILRNLARRKLRSILTISGITIGILALTTMGSLAANFNALLDGGVRYFAASVQVGAENGGIGSLVSTSDLSRIRQVDGVAAAFPNIAEPAKPGDVGVVNFGIPDTITSHDPGEDGYLPLGAGIAQGRDLTATSQGEVVLGYSIAREFQKAPGDTIDLPIKPSDAKPDFVNHRFRVVGVLARTRSAPDNFAEISLADSQQLLADNLPLAIRSHIDPSTLAEAIAVYPKPGVNGDALADRINKQVPGVKAIRPSVLVNGFRSGGAIFTAITTGAALLALIIGGLAVVNTMLMAVTERIREIGLKKAIGAHTRDILIEVLAESTLMGVIGGVAGFGMGALFVTIADASTPPSQSPLFLITPGLAILSLGFAVALGALAGIIPAFRAARMDPVAALRMQ